MGIFVVILYDRHVADHLLVVQRIQASDGAGDLERLTLRIRIKKTSKLSICARAMCCNLQNVNSTDLSNQSRDR